MSPEPWHKNQCLEKKNEVTLRVYLACTVWSGPFLSTFKKGIILLEQTAWAPSTICTLTLELMMCNMIQILSWLSPISLNRGKSHDQGSLTPPCIRNIWNGWKSWKPCRVYKKKDIKYEIFQHWRAGNSSVWSCWSPAYPWFNLAWLSASLTKIQSK